MNVDKGSKNSMISILDKLKQTLTFFYVESKYFVFTNLIVAIFLIKSKV